MTVVFTVIAVDDLVAKYGGRKGFALILLVNNFELNAMLTVYNMQWQDAHMSTSAL